MALLPRALAALLLCAAAALTAPAGAAERAIDKEVVVAAPIEAVWEAWTTKAGVESFFAPEAVVDAKPGGAFHVHFNPFGAPGDKGADTMRYLALQKPRMLSFDWNAPPHLPEARAQRTVVIVRFTALDAQRTQVTLHHVGWGDGGQWDQAHAYFDRAWVSVLGSLRKRFESGPVDWSGWLAQLRAMSAPASAPAK